MAPRGSELDPFKPAIDDILRADLDAPRKQRHTVRRIYHLLLDEYGMADVSYQVVRTYVADRKPKIRAESGRGPIKVFFPRTHRPGAEAEVDFGEVVINLRGEPVTRMLFSFRTSFSGKAIYRIFASGGQRRSSRGTTVGQQSVQFAEQHFKIVQPGQVVVLADRVIVGDTDDIKLGFAADPDQQAAQPGRRLELTDDHRLAVVRGDRADLPFEPQPFPGLGPSRHGLPQLIQREVHDRHYRTAPTRPCSA